MKEYILCSAIHFINGKVYENQPKGIISGIVILGRRHNNCYNTLFLLFPNMEYKNNTIQGFLTNTNRFVNREEAYTIARDANQLLLGDYQKDDEKYRLTSEDLY